MVPLIQLCQKPEPPLSFHSPDPTEPTTKSYPLDLPNIFEIFSLFIPTDVCLIQAPLMSYLNHCKLLLNSLFLLPHSDHNTLQLKKVPRQQHRMFNLCSHTLLNTRIFDGTIEETKTKNNTKEVINMHLPRFIATRGGQVT